MLDTKLIEKSLALTGKTMEDIEVGHRIIRVGYQGGTTTHREFSIEKFCYYLLSHEFIEKYRYISKISLGFTITDYGFAIYEYQRGKEEPLTKLLSKI